MPKQEQSKLQQVYLIVGEDEFSATAAAREKIDGFVPLADQALGLEIIDGRADTIEQALACLRRCLEAVRTVGFLGGRKAIWLRGLDFLGDPVIGRNKQVQEMLEILAGTIAGGIPEGQLLIITAQKLDARTAFYKTCVGNGKLIEFNLAEKPWQRDRGAAAFATQAFKNAGVQIAYNLIETFVQKVGADTMQIMREVEKLTAYLGKRKEVQAADLDSITSSSRELFAWDLEDAVGQRNLSRSITVLRQLLFQREEPIRLISGLEGRFRQLLLLREALDNGWITVQPMGHDNFKMTTADMPEDLAEQFKLALASEKGTPLHPFVAGKLAGQATLFSRPEIERRRAVILNARRRLVSSSMPEQLVLEYLIIHLCRSRARGSGRRTTDGI